MWIADGWKEYEVLDCSEGEKLERWGKYILCRPDPQVIWNTEKRIPEWKKLNGHYHRSKAGGGEWEFHDLPQEWTINYALGRSSASGSSAGGQGDSAIASVTKNNVLAFHLKPFAFKHTGLFPEQAVNWDWFYPQIKTAVGEGRKVRVLNLFAYTGGATLAAAAAGAEVTHVDASKGMVNWAKENAATSGLSEAPIRWLVDDCMKFVEREIRREKKYEAIIMDPPSYGRGPKGELWKLEDLVFPLLQKCGELLSEKPLFFLINSYTTGIQPAVLSYMLHEAVVKKLLSASSSEAKVVAEEIGLPVKVNGLTLPCGASGRVEF